MDVLERLIAESRKLEETASKIQDGTRIGLSVEKIEIFIRAYRDWYAECLSILPYAQQLALQREFEGSEYGPQIREFLTSPTELWEPDMKDILMDEMWMGMARFGVQSPFPDRPPHPYWKYPYKETFYPYLLNQRQALLEATKIRPGRQQASGSAEDEEFDARRLHSEIKACSRSSFLHGFYEAAVLDSYNTFERYLQQKAHSNLSGSKLMREVLDGQSGSLRLSLLQTETQRNEQEGLKHLCMGLVSAIRNPRAHEPAKELPVSREDALDILSLISFLYRQIEKASYVEPIVNNAKNGR